jgi:hypothetical protein
MKLVPFTIVHYDEAQWNKKKVGEVLLLGDGARKDWWRVVGAGAVSPCAW